MTPPSTTEPTTEPEPILDVIPVLTGYVRGTLVGIAVALIGVFAVAALIDPYEPDGAARLMGTHTQLGLTECGFLKVTGVPCPSCGMTTSFALLVRGDVAGSLRANYAGTVLAGFCLLLVPWCLVSAWRRQTVFVRSVEWTLVVVLVGLAALAVVRWMIVVGFTLNAGGA